MKITKVSKIVWIVLLALFVRLFFSYWQYSGDLKNHFVWANSFLDNPTGFYLRHFLGFNDPNYPPLSIYLFGLSLALYRTFLAIILYLNQQIAIFPSHLVPLFQSENMIYAFLKLPGILADIGCGLLIYKLTNKSLIKSTLYLLNPATIYLSAVWGQIESITVFFLLLTIYSPSIIYSFIFLTLGTLTKQTVLWFSPIIIFFEYKKHGLKKVIQSVLVSFVIFLVCYIPVGFTPIKAVPSYLSTLSGSSTVVSDAAWNAWYYLFNQGTNDSVLILNSVSVRFVSILILLFLLILLIKKNHNYRSALFWWSIVVFFFQTRVHERHLAFAIPLFIISSSFTWQSLLAFIALSTYHLLNLMWSLKLPFI